MAQRWSMAPWLKSSFVAFSKMQVNETWAEKKHNKAKQNNLQASLSVSCESLKSSSKLESEVNKL